MSNAKICNAAFGTDLFFGGGEGGLFAKLRKAYNWLPPFRLSVSSSAWNNSTPTGRIFMKFDRHYFSKICRENIKFHKKNPTTITGTLHEDRYTFLIIAR